MEGTLRSRDGPHASAATFTQPQRMRNWPGSEKALAVWVESRVRELLAASTRNGERERDGPVAGDRGQFWMITGGEGEAHPGSNPG